MIEKIERFGGTLVKSFHLFLLFVIGAILVLALAALAVDFSAARFRSPDEDV